MRRMRAFFSAGVGAVVVILAAGCPFPETGSLQPSAEVTVAFGTRRVPEGYRYYVLNSESNPFGLAGLKKGYWMEGPDWRRIEPSAENFRQVLERVQGFPAPGGRTQGYLILDAKREPIGMWYSSLGAGVAVDPDTRRVMLATPTPWLQN